MQVGRGEYRCSVPIIMLMLVSYRLWRCSIVTEKLLIANYRLCKCSVLTEILLLLANYRLCRCSLVIVMFLLVDYTFCGCSVAIELLLESFRLGRYNELTSICYYCSSLPFEVMKTWCTDNTSMSQCSVTKIFLRLIV